MGKISSLAQTDPKRYEVPALQLPEGEAPAHDPTVLAQCCLVAAPGFLGHLDHQKAADSLPSLAEEARRAAPFQAEPPSRVRPRSQ